MPPFFPPHRASVHAGPGIQFQEDFLPPVLESGRNWRMGDPSLFGNGSQTEALKRTGNPVMMDSRFPRPALDRKADEATSAPGSLVLWETQ